MVTRTLSKDRAQRFQSVTDLLGELRKLQSSTNTPTVVTPTQPDVPSIAVLPFVNMSADPEQEYFCDGMAEEIINALTNLEGLHVSARTSSFKFKGQALDATEIGLHLKVSSILEGSVRKAGNRLRITAQLINVADGFHLWSERYDRDMKDVFAPRWTPQKRPLIDTSKPAISGMAAETGGVLPRGLRGTQVGLDLRAPAAWPALEDMAMMQQAIQQGGDGRGVAESFAPVVNGPV